MSDDDLVKNYKRYHNKEIIGEFFNRYMHLVFAVCMKYLKNDEQAKDAVMEIFESLDKKLLKFEIRNFKSWIHKVSCNYCLMELRKKKTKIPIEENKLFRSENVENDLILHPYSEEDVDEYNVVRVLGKLKEAQRKCLELMYFQNKSYKAISLETGYSLKLVKSHIQNGKRKLKLLLKEGR
jgi:RNA polymerase sigma-70 factor (ECF subfamily)